MNDDAWPVPAPGRWLVITSWIGTGVHGVTTVGALVDDRGSRVAFVVAVALFAMGCAMFLAAFALAVGRSVSESIGIGGLYFMAGSSPPSVRRMLMGSLAVEVAVSITVASLRPYTSLATGVLVPVFGLAAAGLWAAKYGRFEPRPSRHTATTRRGSDPSD